MAKDLAELLSRIAKNIMQGGNVRKGSNASLTVPSRSNLPGIWARNPARDAAKKRAVRETTNPGDVPFGYGLTIQEIPESG